MKKEYQLQKDEPLYKWINRLAEGFRLTPEQKDMLIEVSKQSFFQGIARYLDSEKYIKVKK